MTDDNIHDTSMLLSIVEAVASIRDSELKRGLTGVLIGDMGPCAPDQTPTMITAPKWAKEMFARLFA